MKFNLKYFFIIAIFTLTSHSAAKYIHVPFDTKTIQKAILKSDDGDIILVHPGTYKENIFFSGKKVTVASLAFTSGNLHYIPETIIQSDTAGSVVSFRNSEDSLSVLVGFTITGGNGTPSRWGSRGGGVYIGQWASPRLEHLHITKNAAYRGAGIYFGINSTPKMAHIKIWDNLAQIGGGVYFDFNVKAHIEHLTVMENVGFLAGGGVYFDAYANSQLKFGKILRNYSEKGGGFFVYSSQPVISNMTIYGNKALFNGGGLFCGMEAKPILINNIFWHNSPYEIEFSLEYGGRAVVTVSNCIIQGGFDKIQNRYDKINWLAGNIDADPQFSNPDLDDYRLHWSSPAIEKGTAFFEMNGKIHLNMPQSEYYGLAPEIGTEEFYAETKVHLQNEPPDDFQTVQNFPNPFNASTTIRFTLSKTQYVSLSVFNCAGRLIKSLVNNRLEAGTHEIHWEATAQSSGTFFYNIKTEQGNHTGKMLLLR